MGKGSEMVIQIFAVAMIWALRILFRSVTDDTNSLLCEKTRANIFILYCFSFCLLLEKSDVVFVWWIKCGIVAHVEIRHFPQNNGSERSDWCFWSVNSGANRRKTEKRKKIKTNQWYRKWALDNNQIIDSNHTQLNVEHSNKKKYWNLNSEL